MTLKTKVGGEWKEISALKVKIGGEWKDVSTLYSKKDGAWVTVYSSGALITFTNYPYPIPVAAGWKYSTDKTNWTTVTSDSTINDSGTFTGWVKVPKDLNQLTLSGFYTEYLTEQIGLRRSVDGTYNSLAYPASFTLGDTGYCCCGVMVAGSHYFFNSVSKYDSNGTRTLGSDLKYARGWPIGFTIGDSGFVCGGSNQSYGLSGLNYVEMIDANGNSSVVNPMSENRIYASSISSEDSSGYGMIIGGKSTSSTCLSSIDLYSASGVRTTGGTLSIARAYSTAFTLGGMNYVFGGYSTADNSKYLPYFEAITSSGVSTQLGNSLIGRSNACSFTLSNHAYICGGYNSTSKYLADVEILDSNGNLTLGSPISVARQESMSFVYDNKGAVCGGATNAAKGTVDILDQSGVWTLGSPLGTARYASASFAIGSVGFICGGRNSSDYYDVADMYYNLQEELWRAKIPVTKGTEYTLNNVSVTASKSQILSFDEKVSGTIKYKAGTIPSS